MAGVVFDPQISTVLKPTVLPRLEQAFSVETNRIARLVAELRNEPSPASLKSLPRLAPDQPPLEVRLFDALAAVKILTAQVAMHLDGEWRRRLFEQLDSLHDPEEWEAGDDEPVGQSSFATFLKAILSIRPERRPGLGLSHTGNVIAAWTTGQDRLTIEFLPNDRVRWVLGLYHDGEPDRFAGQTPVTRLAEGLAPYRPEHWFSHESKDNEFTR
jgi:hypothetical protein